MAIKTVDQLQQLIDSDHVTYKTKTESPNVIFMVIKTKSKNKTFELHRLGYDGLREVVRHDSNRSFKKTVSDYFGRSSCHTIRSYFEVNVLPYIFEDVSEDFPSTRNSFQKQSHIEVDKPNTDDEAIDTEHSPANMNHLQTFGLGIDEPNQAVTDFHSDLCDTKIAFDLALNKKRLLLMAKGISVSTLELFSASNQSPQNEILIAEKEGKELTDTLNFLDQAINEADVSDDGETTEL